MCTVSDMYVMCTVLRLLAKGRKEEDNQQPIPTQAVPAHEQKGVLTHLCLCSLSCMQH